MTALDDSAGGGSRGEAVLQGPPIGRENAGQRAMFDMDEDGDSKFQKYQVMQREGRGWGRGDGW